MIIKKYNQIMQKSEEQRNKWALGLALTLSVFIFVSFAFYKGFLSFGNNSVIAQKESESQIVATDIPSPLENSKKTFGAAFSEIGKQYKLFKESIAGVLVPFVTGIEVYERK